jgi:hypothetical protein
LLKLFLRHVLDLAGLIKQDCPGTRGALI